MLILTENSRDEAEHTDQVRNDEKTLLGSVSGTLGLHCRRQDEVDKRSGF